ncbi:hypothetical protein PGT21_017964 [Puccinia graminis f. sp. tritici]|uniref:Hydrophobin n=2 Tax=Puccinia graminis f. sp. tritici TaxID=56615 RepID=E3KXL6_PUCGT|nr:uncharacterized protein PGTG_14919 [Puccinia graminis f. sp. tritici CRL 75-36-700-3]EFP89078.1 hypothetical protein PGTG_14919 [Puccinia graminis f. sp. tritici CRL 75-36-700-3]KAA1066003.1 hypothetical protein PGT21_017964 [Puccinia graminis f. sp. tritici]KAA1130362.1 hypothetical protein PGTUg99_021724 [Puccinia graminis f. sp. tritici]
MNLSSLLGISMVLFSLQLQMAMVESMGCGNAGNDFKYAGCAKHLKKEAFPGGDPRYWSWMMDVIPPPWKTDHYDCKGTNYPYEVCCSIHVENIKNARDTRLAYLCRKPNGANLQL